MKAAATKRPETSRGAPTGACCPAGQVSHNSAVIALYRKFELPTTSMIADHGSCRCEPWPVTGTHPGIGLSVPGRFRVPRPPTSAQVAHVGTSVEDGQSATNRTGTPQARAHRTALRRRSARSGAALQWRSFRCRKAACTPKNSVWKDPR
jgi:hypothetical protein